MCGIAGFNLKNISEKDINDFQLLGCLNMSRGRHSSGLYINNWTNKYANEWSEFIKDFNLHSEMNYFKENNIGMLHTRHATIGGKTTANAHPFVIKDPSLGKNPDEQWKIVFQHNGTISNIGELCKKYNIERDHSKTDSEHLGKIIANSGYKVLSEYEGAAALSWVEMDGRKPEDYSLFLWKGASKYYHNQNTKIVERFLHFVETENGIWFCSERESLELVFPSEKVNPVPANTVIEIRNGKIINKTKIKRDVFEKKFTEPSSRGSGGGSSTGNTGTQSIINYNKKNTTPEIKVGSKVKEIIEYYKNILDKLDLIYFNGERYIYKGFRAHGKFAVYDSGDSSFETVYGEAEINNFNLDLEDDDAVYFYQGIYVKDKSAFDKLSAINLDVNSQSTLASYLSEFTKEGSLFYAPVSGSICLSTYLSYEFYTTLSHGAKFEFDTLPLVCVNGTIDEFTYGSRKLNNAVSFFNKHFVKENTNNSTKTDEILELEISTRLKRNFYGSANSLIEDFSVFAYTEGRKESEIISYGISIIKFLDSMDAWKDNASREEFKEEIRYITGKYVTLEK